MNAQDTEQIRSLAVSLSREFNQTLVGFLRGERFNVYAAPARLAA